MTGENIGNQRLRILDQEKIFIGEPFCIREKRLQDFPAVFSSETFIKFISGENDTVVKIFYKLADFLHMGFPVGTAEKMSFRGKHAAYLFQHGRNIITVKKHMVGDHQIKAFIFVRNFFAVKSPESKTGIRGTDSASGIAEHAAGDVRKCNGDIFRDQSQIVSPESSVTAAQFQDTKSRFNVALLKNPWKPALFVL